MLLSFPLAGASLAFLIAMFFLLRFIRRHCFQPPPPETEAPTAKPQPAAERECSGDLQVATLGGFLPHGDLKVAATTA